MIAPKYQKGVTLIEVMLVLAIALTLFTFGIRLYQQFQFSANEQQIANTVDQLFNALKGYYYANCRQVLDHNYQAQTPGNLDPNVAKNNKVQIDIQSLLVTPGFIPKWNPSNSLLDSTQGNGGYFAQFNRIQNNGQDAVMNVNACTGSTRSPSCDKITTNVLASNAKPALQSHVVMWTIQVAVKLNSSLTSQQWTQIQHDLNADCISTQSGGVVSACVPQPNQDGYLVWTRLPSAYNANVDNTATVMMPYVADFNRQYTNDGMAVLNGVQNETQNGNKTWVDPQNYLCGG